MTQSSFTVGVVVAYFHWKSGGPHWTKRNNTDVYSGTIEFIGNPSVPSLPITDMENLASMWREIAVRPIDGSAGVGFFVDYNGVTDPSGTLVMSDGSSLLNMVLSAFQRSNWMADFQEADVEFTRTV